MNILGISAGFHDAAAAVISHNGDILFAGHSERYSKVKNDPHIHNNLIQDVNRYGPIGHVAYYEVPWKKQARRLYSGEGVEWNKLTLSQILANELSNKKLRAVMPRFSCHNHHLSHAAAGFQTSPYDRATVVVIDAIGEWDTISIWAAEYNAQGQVQYKKLWSQQYPHSIGLFYSAMTQRVGLKPNEDEYVLMGMAAYGKHTGQGYSYTKLLVDNLVDNLAKVTFKENFHIGVSNTFEPELDDVNLAAAAQQLLEKLVYRVMSKARDFGWSSNLVYMGGVALNCSANRNLGDYFENIWIMPNPGDAGSSLGAAALKYGRRLNWVNAYLGHNISGSYPITPVLDSLLSDGICGVASGRAEFGPRALGNRSLLADPRRPDIKDRVNEIKRRQKFRPFAPVILEEMADRYFYLKSGWNTEYMQFVALCKEPHDFPAICHVDGTSRVQTVPKDGSGIRELLERWFVLTDCPMLLNTSLNIRGEPMVNDRSDADRFEEQYKVKVHS